MLSLDDFILFAVLGLAIVVGIGSLLEYADQRRRSWRGRGRPQKSRADASLRRGGRK